MNIFNTFHRPEYTADDVRLAHYDGWKGAIDDIALRQTALDFALRDAPRRGREDITALAQEFYDFLTRGVDNIVSAF